MDDPNKLPLSEVLSYPARFVHPDYLKAYPNNRNGGWLKWLHDSLNINTVPRLYNGKLSEEFEDFFNINDTETWLQYLKDYWFDLVLNAKGKTSFMEEISNMIAVVDAGGRSQRRLKLSETYLRTATLSSFTNLPFLPIHDFRLDDWSFLKQLGVSSDVDAKLCVSCLLDIDKRGNVDVNMISTMYRQLNARFNDDNGKRVEWIRYLFVYTIRFKISYTVKQVNVCTE